MRVSLTLAMLLAGAATAAAHEGPHGAPANGSSLWDVAVLVVLALSGALYALGSRRIARVGARVRTLERVAFWAGWTALVVAVAPWMDAAAAVSFSSHMAQHELLMLVGAPLVIVGRPIVPWLWAVRQFAIGRSEARLKPGTTYSYSVNRPLTTCAAVWNWLTQPVVAWVLHGATIWVWHLPALYEAAVGSEAVHALQHLTFVATAACFWWGLVYGRYGRAAYGASVFYVFSTSAHTGVLGAFFALSTAPFYGIYRERAAAAGIDPVVDQQLAGLYMWIPAGVVLTLFGLALAVAWLSEAERRTTFSSRTTTILLWSLVVMLLSACRMEYDREARALTGGEPSRGRVAITRYGCDTCHTIPGVATADATVGPPLTRIARRMYLAGRLENTPENMSRWIRNPHDIDPGTVMPDTGVSAGDARDITAYLYTLR